MKSIKLYKTAENGLIAHIFEHVVCNFIAKKMTESNLFLMTDYDLFGETFGKTCFIEANFYSEKSHSFFLEIVNNLQFNLPEKLLKISSEQCALEFNREISNLDLNKLHQEVDFINSQKWKNFHQFTEEKAEDSTSVNTIHSINSISTNEKKKVFEFEFLYSNNRQDTLSKRALSMIIMQFLALNFYNSMLLETGILFYDSGDDWISSEKNLEYQTFVKFTQKPNPDNIVNLFQHSKAVNQEKFTQNLYNLFQNNYSQDFTSNPFSQNLTNELLYGGIVGGKFWKNITKSQILKSIQSTSLEINQLD